jgi:hypothetical protein
MEPKQPALIDSTPPLSALMAIPLPTSRRMAATCSALTVATDAAGVCLTSAGLETENDSWQV